MSSLPNDPVPLYDFNPGTKTWKIHAHKISSIANGNLVLQANGENSEIYFAQKNNEVYKISDLLGSDYVTVNSSPGSISIGQYAMSSNAGTTGNIAIGHYASQNNSHNSGTYRIAIGYEAGKTNQGGKSISIGYKAGENNQASNSIILNASGNTLNAANTGFFVNPIRSDGNNTNFILCHDTTTNEIKRGGIYISGTNLTNANVVSAQNFNIGGSNVISASRQGNFTDLELKNNYGTKLLIDGDTGDITAWGTLSIDNIIEKTSGSGVTIGGGINITGSNLTNANAISAQNFNIGGTNVISAARQGNFRDIEMKNNSNQTTFLAYGDTGNIDIYGNLSVDNITEKTSGSGVTIQSNLKIQGNTTGGSGEIELNCENNSHAVKIKGPPHSAGATYTLTLPNDVGTDGYVLKTDGTGNLSWTEQTGGGGDTTSTNDINVININQIDDNSLNIISNNTILKAPQLINSDLTGVSEVQQIDGTSNTQYGKYFTISPDSKYIFITHWTSPYKVEVRKNNGTLENPNYTVINNLDTPSYLTASNPMWGWNIRCNYDATILIIPFRESTSYHGYSIFYRNANSDTFIEVDNSPFVNVGNTNGHDMQYVQGNFLSENGKYFTLSDPWTAGIDNRGTVTICEVKNATNNIILDPLFTIQGDVGEHLGSSSAISNNGYFIIGSYVANDNWKGRVYLYKYDETNNTYSEIWRFDNPPEYIINKPNDDLGKHTTITPDGNYIAFSAWGQDIPESAANDRGWIRVYKKGSSDSEWNQVGNEITGQLESEGGGEGRFEALGYSYLYLKKIGEELIFSTSFSQNRSTGYAAGAAWIYNFKENVDTTWNLLQKFIPPDSSQWHLGDGLSMSYNIIGVGLPGIAGYTLPSPNNHIKIYKFNIQEEIISNDANVIIDGNLTVKKISSAINDNKLLYNSTTGEITYQPDAGGVNHLTIEDSPGGIFIGQNTAANILSSDNVISIGNYAGNNVSTATTDRIAIGNSAGYTEQQTYSICIGTSAGQMGGSSRSVIIGYRTGMWWPGSRSVFIGEEAGYNGSSSEGVQIGYRAGYQSAGYRSVGIGNLAASTGQGNHSVYIGDEAGATGLEKDGVIGIGNRAGHTHQLDYSIAIGTNAGWLYQKSRCVAIGLSAGRSNQGAYSVAIGCQAGNTDQAANSIVLNAQTDTSLDTTNTGFYVKPIRDNASSTNHKLVYDTGTGEISYQPDSGGGGGSINHVTVSDSPGPISIGQYATSSNAGTDGNIAIGHYASHTNSHNSGKYRIAIGYYAGYSQQYGYSVAIGYEAGKNDQKDYSLAIGHHSGVITQGRYAVALGNAAGYSNQNDGCVAVGSGAGQNNQGAHSVAIGGGCGTTNQASFSVAVGHGAANYNTLSLSNKEHSVAVGLNAGNLNQYKYSVAVGRYSGNQYQGESCTAIGNNAGKINQGNYSLALGALAGQNDQAANSIVLNAQTNTALEATNSGFFVKPIRNVASGTGDKLCYHSGTGEITYQPDSGGGINHLTVGEKVSIGTHAGITNQAAYAIAIGHYSGNYNQSTRAVAIGISAGQWTQGWAAVGVGEYAGSVNSGYNAIAIGAYAGYTGQGAYSIAIGREAGKTNQAANSIVLNAQGAGSDYNPSNSGFYVKPIRDNASSTNHKLVYDTGTGEISYQPDSGGGGGGGSINHVTVSDDPGPISIGQYAMTSNAGTDRNIAIGHYASHSNSHNSGTYRIAIGYRAGKTNQYGNSIAIGKDAGITDQKTASVAIGLASGATYLGQNSVAIGYLAGNYNNNTSNGGVVAIGDQAAEQYQGDYAVAIGRHAARTNQGYLGIAIGNYSGNSSQGPAAIAIGPSAGQTNQGGYSVAIGYETIKTGNINYEHSIAIGSYAGKTNQHSESIGIGYKAGHENQNVHCVAIGRSAGQNNQGIHSVALGSYAGETNQAANSIVLNAQQYIALNAPNSGFFVKPIRDNASSTGHKLVYDNGTGEISYQSDGGGGGGGGVSELNDLTDAYKDATNLVLGSDLVRHEVCNTIVGVAAGGSNNWGQRCTYIGHACGRYNSSSFSVAMGHETLRNGDGNHNTAIGYVASCLATGACNTTLGSHALYSGSGGNNVAIGFYALRGDNITGNNNVAIGYCAHGQSPHGGLSLTGSNNIIIGASSQASSTSINNEITLGNSSNNLFRMPGLGGSNGNVLTYNNGYIEFSSGSTSDDRLKHDERNITNGLEIVRQLKPQVYKKTHVIYETDVSGSEVITRLDVSGNKIFFDASYNGDIGLEGYQWNYSSGLIAQDVKLIPDLSFAVIDEERHYDSSNNLTDISPMGLDYEKIFTYNIAATKELDAIVQQQQNTIQEQQNLINNLISRIEILEAK